jgi:GNAT superfamily N-acetyltransferase
MDVVMQQAYDTSSFRDSIERFATVQPDGLVVVEEMAGRGDRCCVAYPDGKFGWIGLVATAPGFERRGIATAITEHLCGVLAGLGCGSVLDASLAGGPVYERRACADRGRRGHGIRRRRWYRPRRSRASRRPPTISTRSCGSMRRDSGPIVANC